MKIIPILLILTVFVSGCVSNQQTEIEDTTPIPTNTPVQVVTVTEKNVPEPTPTLIVTSNIETQELTELAKNYYRYDPDAYQQALETNKVIFLDFHANWCPVCKVEDPKIKNAFNILDNPNVIGFQVHYNDEETQSYDTDIAQKYQVAYQYTKVILKKDGSVSIKTLERFDTTRTLSELTKAAS